MKKLLGWTIAAMFAAGLAGCGRDDNQEKAGASAAKKETATAPAAAPDAPKGPLQTGEQTGTAADVPSGTATGARTTPNPQ
jgi:uncharacterized lipoprotein